MGREDHARAFSLQTLASVLKLRMRANRTDAGMVVQDLLKYISFTPYLY